MKCDKAGLEIKGDIHAMPCRHVYMCAECGPRANQDRATFNVSRIEDIRAPSNGGRFL
jgi:hypothetical protein